MSAPRDPEFEQYRRRLPHWRLDGSVYFITFRLLTGSLAPREIILVRDHVRDGHLSWYTLLAVQVMPDHAHVILKPISNFSLSRIMKGIKGASSRKINRLRNSSGTLWQDESWDHAIRNSEDLDEKLTYMFENPLKAGLVDSGDEWIGWHVERKEI